MGGTREWKTNECVVERRGKCCSVDSYSHHPKAPPARCAKLSDFRKDEAVYLRKDDNEIEGSKVGANGVSLPMILSKNDGKEQQTSQVHTKTFV
jgi:hypothetical protein